MRMKKLLQGTLAVAAAAATWAAVGTTDADAANPTVGKATIVLNTETQTLTVTPKTTNKEILFGVATKTQKTVSGTKQTIFKVASWDVHDTDGTKAINIDLSKLSNTKDNYVELRTDNDSTPVIIKIPAVAKANKISYDAEKNTLTFRAGASTKEADLKPVTAYEVRTATGSWSAAAELTDGAATDVFSEYQYQGATLYLRTPGTADAEIAESATDTNVYVDDQDAVVEKTYTTSSFPGKETKLTIAKQANGPAVKVSYAKATVKMLKDTEYRVWSSAIPKVNTPVGENAGKEVAISTLLGEELDTATLEVRTVKAGKCASKWTRVSLAKATKISDDNITVGTKTNPLKTTGASAGDEIKYGGLGISAAKITGTVNDEATDLVTVKYDKSEFKSEKWTTSVIFTSVDANNAYEIYVAADDDEKNAPKDGETIASNKLKTLAAKAANKNSSTLTLTKVADGSVIYIRVKGVDKTKTLTGLWTKLGTVDAEKTYTMPAEEE